MFTFTVTPDGAEEFEVTAKSRDITAWEMRKAANSLTAMQKDMRMTVLYEIAHIAAHRQGLFEGNLNEFRTTCDIELVKTDEDDSDDQSDPTQLGL